VGRRTIRYRAHELSSCLEALKPGMLLQVVLKKGQTLTGNYVRSSQQSIWIEDGSLPWYNKNKGSYEIILSDIDEISRDLVTLY
jgi:hypothetical protein